MNKQKNEKSFESIKYYFRNDFTALINFLQKSINVKICFKSANYIRHAGADAQTLFMLCLFKIIGSDTKSVNSFAINSLSKASNISIHSIYRFENNGKINWRELHYCFIKILYKLLNNRYKCENIDGDSYLVLE